ncbi:MAG TPA: IS1634 family transposase, partial [Myxococcota bacterium]|nr:IS1634 family transposase [Myxococcota bacterium]
HLYAALDWLYERQPEIQRRLLQRYLKPGGLVFYDLSSSYLTGRHCPLARLGFSRDGKRGTLQIAYGLLANRDGLALAVEVFKGDTVDTTTVVGQADKLQSEYGLERMVLVGDRGMLSNARVEELAARGMGWITALRAPQIQALLARGSLQLGIFDERNLAEISDPAYPGERLVVCRNPLLAEERQRKREDLLRATEAKLAPIRERVEAGRLRGRDAIGIAVGKMIDRHKVGKHFAIEIKDERLRVERKEAEIAAEAALDGIYVLRTSVPAAELEDLEVVRTYKRLAKLERSIRRMKSFDVQVRPVHHYSENRVRAHVFLCMLAAHLEWHLEDKWAPLLFKDEQPPLAEDPVAPARRSSQALRKASSKQLEDGTPVHSLRTLLNELATITRDRLLPEGAPPESAFELVTVPSEHQTHALRLLGVNSGRL